MAKHGFMIESKIAATNVGSLGRDAVAEVNVDGGNLVVLTSSGKQGDEVWKATAPSAGKLGELYMAYNPAPKYADWQDKTYAGLSANVRDYTNIAGLPFSVFKVCKEDQIDLSIDVVDTTGGVAVAGDFLESKAGQTTLTRVAAATGATAGSTAFRIDWVGSLPFPKTKGIGMDMVKVFRVTCVQA
jgi:hypothetical protein